jgi:signal transduction histidine kinase
MPTTFEERLAELKHGDHIALFYTEPAEAIAAAAPFIALGLARGEQCFMVMGEYPLDQIAAALANAGVDVVGAQARGALVLQHIFPIPYTPGMFDFAAVYTYMQQTIDQALAQGFTGVRLVAEMTWALAAESDTGRLVTYEALGNHLFDANPFVAMCQYNRRRFDPRILRDMLRTHPLVLVGSQVCPNFYYERPDLVLNPDALAEKVDWMIAQLARARQAEEEHLRLIHERMARAAAEEARQHLQQFMSMVAHELGNALTTIISGVQILRLRMHSESLERLQQRVATIEGAERRVRRLLRDLTSAARIGSGEFTIQPVPIDLVVVARRVIQQQTAADQQRLILDAPNELRGEWDRERMSQVLANLISNALKYAPPATEVRVSVCRCGGKAMLRVTDHGRGMAPDQIAHLFQPFSRLHPEAGVDGSGLGLYVCKGIVEAHGGRIWVESELGKGSVFCVALPLREAYGMVTSQLSDERNSAVR